MTKLTYSEMYAEAAEAINANRGKYKGYTGGNALSVYVGDKYGVNAAGETAAHDALCEAAYLLDLTSEEFVKMIDHSEAMNLLDLDE